MQRIRPDYYDKFRCIADQCPITCCQEWKIAVDADTNTKWKRLKPPKEVQEQKKNLSAYTIQQEGNRVIGLDKDHRCPFLAENKLCRLVSAYGEEVLSETCTVFPREVHRFAKHEEETLMPCCPAVLDLWKEGEIQFPEIPQEERNFLFQIRREVVRILQDRENTVETALLQSFYVLRELLQSVSPEEAVAEYFSEDTLRQLRQAIAEVELPALDTMEECNELLQDLAVNYRKEGLYQTYLDPVIRLSEQLSDSYDTEEMSEKWTAFQQELTRYEPLIRNFLANEIFSDLLMPEGDLEQMVIQMQWIAMEYTAIRQCLFLAWLQGGCEALTYKSVQDYMVIITRMTGYEEEDILEYLQNSFEELIWEWGYFALIVGKDGIY